MVLQCAHETIASSSWVVNFLGRTLYRENSICYSRLLTSRRVRVFRSSLTYYLMVIVILLLPFFIFVTSLMIFFMEKRRKINR